MANLLHKPPFTIHLLACHLQSKEWMHVQTTQFNTIEQKATLTFTSVKQPDSKIKEMAQTLLDTTEITSPVQIRTEMWSDDLPDDLEQFFSIKSIEIDFYFDRPGPLTHIQKDNRCKMLRPFLFEIEALCSHLFPHLTFQDYRLNLHLNNQQAYLCENFFSPNFSSTPLTFVQLN